eukprot:PhM_4_TR17804/c0_g1_i1/m.18962
MHWLRTFLPLAVVLCMITAHVHFASNRQVAMLQKAQQDVARKSSDNERTIRSLAQHALRAAAAAESNTAARPEQLGEGVVEASATDSDDGVALQPLGTVGIVTLNSPGGYGVHRRSGSWMWPYAVYNRRKYAERHGYGVHVDGRAVVDPRTPPSWSKIKTIRKYLPRYKWLMWLDIDALFMDYSKTVEEVIVAGAPPSADIIMSKDHNGLNCGVMLFRNSPWTMQFLSRVWHWSGDRRHVWQEQYALMQIVATDPAAASHFHFLPQQRMNAYPDMWRRGDLIVHMVNCESRAHTCWEEFKGSFDTSLRENGLVDDFRGDQTLETQPGLI